MHTLMTVLTEDQCIVHVNLWACSPDMNIIDNTMRPRKPIITLGHNCTPTEVRAVTLSFPNFKSWFATLR